MPALVCQLVFAAAMTLSQPQSQSQSEPLPAPKEAQSQPADLSSRLDALDRKIAAIKDLTADFEQQKKTVLLKKPMVSCGTIKLKGAKTRWDTKKPHETVMTIDASEVRIYYPEQKTVEVYPMQGDMARLASSPLPRIATIRENFDIAEAKPADLNPKADPKASGDLLALSLTPKTAELKEHIQRIRVLIDLATACAKSVEITDADDDQTTITFTNVKVDSGLTDKDVDLVTPPGTTTSHPLEGGTPKPEGQK